MTHSDRRIILKNSTSPIFVGAQQPTQAALRPFGIFLTLKLILPLCGILVLNAECMLQVGREVQTGERLIQMTQRKTRC